MWGFNRHAIDHFRSAQYGRTLYSGAIPHYHAAGEGAQEHPDREPKGNGASEPAGQSGRQQSPQHHAQIEDGGHVEQEAPLFAPGGPGLTLDPSNLLLRF